MRHTQTHKKEQTFVLFWLGLLTGALLIIALYSSGSNSGDVLGNLRSSSMPSYAPPVFSQSSQMVQPRSLAPQNYNLQNNYGVPTNDNYNIPTNDSYGYNSLLHVAVPTTSSRVNVVAPSMNRYGVTTPNYGVASQYAPVNNYGIPTNDGYSVR